MVQIRYLFARIIPAVFLLFLAGIMFSCTRTFRASVVKIDITPESSQWLRGYGPRQSDGVHDHLYHRIVAMDDGKHQFFLVSTDNACFNPSLYHNFCKQLDQETGISEEQVWWTVTHTHSAPMIGDPGVIRIMFPNRYQADPNPEYTGWVLESLKEGIKQARANLEPARLGAGTGEARANINRRAEDAEGNIRLGENPGRPVNRQLGIIRLERRDGSLLALIANYAIHGTALGHKRQISGDVPGIVAGYVEKMTGAPMLFINGAAGNAAPVNSGRWSFQDISEFNRLLGDEILKTNKAISNTTGKVNLHLSKQVIESPRKPGFGWLEELSEYSRITGSGDTLVRLPVCYLQINEELMIWSLPGELFSQIAMEVREHSPFKNTFYFGYTNGTLGYFPIKKAFHEGGYEPRISVFTGRLEADLTRGVISHLQGMGKSR